MRKVLTGLCLIIATITTAQIKFKTRISTGGFNNLNKVIQIDDGSYIGIGTKDYQQENGDILLVKLNQQGVLLSSRTFGSPGYDVGASIIKTSDNGFAISGILNNQAAILKFDVNLNLQWEKHYSFSTNGSGGARLVQSADGGFIMAGYALSNDDKQAGYLVKTDNLGNLLFSRQLFEFGDNYYNIIDIQATNDGNYALLAQAVDSDNTHDTTYLVKINAVGNVLWSSYVNTSTDVQNSLSFIQASDGGIVIAGSVTKEFTILDSPFPIAQMMMVKFNASGSRLWSKRMENPDIRGSQGWAVVEDTDGGYIFSGDGYRYDTTQFIQDSVYAYLVKLSTGGTLQWTKTFDKSALNTTSFTHIIRTSDQGFAVAGTTVVVTNDEPIVNGIIYKFDNGFANCGNVGTNGTIIDIGTGISRNVPVNSINPVAANDQVESASVGTGINYCDILPVNLISFSATPRNMTVTIEWKLTNGVNVDRFTVERSNNARAFSTLQEVAAKGFSAAMQTYSVTDTRPLSGTSYYRLKETDKDGITTYSKTASVIFIDNESVMIYPNPVNKTVSIKMNSQTNSSVMFEILNVKGSVLNKKSSNIVKGINSFDLPAASLSKGMYILRIIKNNNVQSIKFMKQ